MASSFTFMRIRGVPIGIHWSWVLVFGLIVWSLATNLFPATAPGLSTSAYVAMGTVTALLFFVSILLHELGHTFQALNEDMRITGITLWLFGGVAQFRSTFRSPGVEFRVAIAGPAVTLGLAGAFFGLTALIAGVGGPGWLETPARYLFQINLLLLAFNLVPALPLDGGRVLRSWLWHRQDSYTAATSSAAKAGKAFGGLLSIVGFLGFFTGGTSGGLWLVVLGWFLVQAASAEQAFVFVRRAFADTSVGDLMTRDPVTVPRDMTVAELLEQVGPGGRHAAYPVVAEDRPVGLISLAAAGKVAAAERATTPIERVMTSLEEAPTVDPGAEMIEAYQVLQQEPKRALVLSDGRLEGIVSESDALHHLRVQEARGLPEEKGARGAGIAVWVIVGAMMLSAAGYLYRPPVIVMTPGPSFDVTKDVRISGIETDEVDGAYLLTSVRLIRPNGLGLVAALFDSASDVVPRSQVFPEGVDPERFSRRQQEIFDQSRVLAAAAAAEAIGMDVSVNGDGARVLQVLPGSPAEGNLREGDVVVSVDGDPVKLATELQQLIQRRSAGTRVELEVERNGRQQTLTVETARLQELGTVGIGVVIATHNFDVDLPFDITFTERNIGGPSAGLAYALAVADILDPADLSAGRRVATTGTVGIDGEIGPIGEVQLKGIGAADRDADIFIVPRQQASEVDVEGLEVHGARELADAIQILRRT